MFFIGFIFTSIIGTLGHFIYKCTGIKLFKYIFARDEGLWSHLKLGITPMIIWSIFCLFSTSKNILPLTSYGILIYISIISVVYLFGKIIKKEIPVLNISSFYISVFISYLFIFLMYNMVAIPTIIFIIGYILYIIYILLYFILSKSY